MSNSEKIDVWDKLGAACDNFSSTLKTIHLFDQFVDDGVLSIPEEEVEDVRNRVKAPLAIMLSCFQNDIEELQTEINKEADSFRDQED
jgi:hypothetical protein